ncbi:hypothetical protein [Pseudomonas chlororaphis]|uniref:hypothetical protein n=1 Tax=Pseudomonas chlororaphis TaxID=587753 RepID=UPI0023650712|nr:hypothetical protein [Pseudomonas chlororaphis]WDH25021.1 hypothetical protein PUP50_12335 [Pseudomonas chlororaphis]
MTIDKEKLKPVIEFILEQEQKNLLDDGDAYDAAWSIYDAEVTPASVLSLIAEIDQLKAELSGLRTGFEAQNQVNAELKAENEALRKSLTECSNSLHGEMLQKFGGQLPEDMHPVTRREYDRDMAEVAGYRAALGKGEQP